MVSTNLGKACNYFHHFLIGNAKEIAKEIKKKITSVGHLNKGFQIYCIIN